MESMSCNLQTVLQAIDALYNVPDPVKKKSAGQWLNEFQKSVSYYFINKNMFLLLSFF